MREGWGGLIQDDFDYMSLDKTAISGLNSRLLEKHGLKACACVQIVTAVSQEA